MNVASAGGAYTLVLVVAHEQAGQRDLSTPGVRDQITQTLRSRREQLLRAAYLTAARSDAAWSTTWRAPWSNRRAPCRACCPHRRSSRSPCGCAAGSSLTSPLEPNSSCRRLGRSMCESPPPPRMNVITKREQDFASLTQAVCHRAAHERHCQYARKSPPALCPRSRRVGNDRLVRLTRGDDHGGRREAD